MRRVEDNIYRPDWQELIAGEGLVYWPTQLTDGRTVSYWNEAAFYEFTMPEVLQMERDAQMLFDMLVEAGDYLTGTDEYEGRVQTALLVRMGIPEWAHDIVIKTWRETPAYQSIYGRYDVRFGGHNHPDPSMRRLKLLEFNADTPTALVESAVCQWNWHESTGRGVDQWNSIYERLVDGWKRNLAIVEDKIGFKPVIYFGVDGSDASGEDLMTIQCLRDACEKAGYSTRTIQMDHIHLHQDGRFYEILEHEDPDTPDEYRHIDVLFKLYPWEWLLEQEFGGPAFFDMYSVGQWNADRTEYMGGTLWIEAPYKLLWSNKAILAILWMLFKDDPEKSQLLLPAYFEEDRPSDLTAYIRKPIFGREGASMSIVVDGEEVQVTEGAYGDNPYIVQEYAPLPHFEGDQNTDNHPVLGIWMVDGEAAGMGIRESDGVVTDNFGRFAPHVITRDDQPLETNLAA